MRIEILGSAAGGGFPQWNCNCRNCRLARAGTFQGKIRGQTQIAVTHDGDFWFLLNASPDLRTQLERTRVLWPRAAGKRDSPIAGVLLTSADLDQITGLLSLRELQPFRIYCTPSLRLILQEDNSIFSMLNRTPNQVQWTDVQPGESFRLQSVGGEDSGIDCQIFSLGSRYPLYVSAERAAKLRTEEALLGVMLTPASGKKMAYLPAVPAIDKSLVDRLTDCDLILFDGTFWSEDELIAVQGSGLRAGQMGHLPVSGPDGSMRRLAAVTKAQKIFVHVNNTNPLLDESSPENAEARAAGWQVAEDGWTFEL